MRLTKSNYWDEAPMVFYKASFSGVDECIAVDSPHGDIYQPGYVCGSMFQSLKNDQDLNHLDHKTNGYFTEQSEALEFHRQAVVDYVVNLNNSTFKDNPITI